MINGAIILYLDSNTGKVAWPPPHNVDVSMEVAVAYNAFVRVSYTSTAKRCFYVCLHSQMLYRTVFVNIFKESLGDAVAAISNGMPASVKVSTETGANTPLSKVNVLRQPDIAFLVCKGYEIFLAADIILRSRNQLVAICIFIIPAVTIHHTMAVGEHRHSVSA